MYHLTSCIKSISRLPSSASLHQFREQAFSPRRPHILPQTFDCTGRLSRWFDSSCSYLKKIGGHKLVTVELRDPKNKGYGRRAEVPLHTFIDVFCNSDEEGSLLGYLAQSDLLSIIPELKQDVDVPIYVNASEQPSMYGASTWIGRHTLTPLHRDPNDNIFIHITGTKRVRMYPPEAGPHLQLDPTTPFRNTSSIDDVWEDEWEGKDELEGFEGVLKARDGLYIPRGWWHTLKSEGTAVTGSLNWWFR